MDDDEDEEVFDWFSDKFSDKAEELEHITANAHPDYEGWDETIRHWKAYGNKLEFDVNTRFVEVHQLMEICGRSRQKFVPEELEERLTNQFVVPADKKMLIFSDWTPVEVQIETDGPTYAVKAEFKAAVALVYDNFDVLKEELGISKRKVEKVIES